MMWHKAIWFSKWHLKLIYYCHVKIGFILERKIYEKSFIKAHKNQVKWIINVIQLKLKIDWKTLLKLQIIISRIQIVSWQLYKGKKQCPSLKHLEQSWSLLTLNFYWFDKTELIIIANHISLHDQHLRLSLQAINLNCDPNYLICIKTKSNHRH